MALTDATVRTIKPEPKSYKLFDSGGLYLLVTPAGGKLWRFKYRFNRKEKLLALGAYPDVGLKQARLKRDDARRELANGVDPGELLRAAKLGRIERSENSFKSVALRWHDINALPTANSTKPHWTSQKHAEKVKRLFENDLFPLLGQRPVADISPPELLKILRQIEERGAVDTAHRARAYCSEVFCFAIAEGIAERDPAADLRRALKTVQGKHFAAVLDPNRIGEMLRAFDGHRCTRVVSTALRLMPLVFVRPGDLRKARWADIDIAACDWRFTTGKGEIDHIVHLATQSLALLKALHPFTCDSPYVFPNGRSKSRPMSESAILAALRSMGYEKEEVCGHGFRATARTLLEETLGFPYNIIEHQLAHAVRDPNGRAYNRTMFIDERRRMMQAWADHLDRLKAETKD